MQVELLTEHADVSLEMSAWSEWMNATGLILSRYHRIMSNDDPFAYNETASVSMLCSAATVAGFTAIAEYSCKKRCGNGRADLYIADVNRGWSFEFKTWIPIHSIREDGRLRTAMQAARDCASQLICEDGDRPVAGLILPLSNIKRPEHLARTISSIRKIVQDRQYYDLGWLISDPASNSKVALLFALLA